MVKFQIASDLHIEHRKITDPLQYINPTADNLILAGDIGCLYKYNQLNKFLTTICPLFETVIYVPGNAEYYKNNKCIPTKMKYLFDRLKTIQNNIPNLYILDRNSIRIDNVCIIGCTLWSNPNVKVPSFIVRIQGMNTNVYTKKHLRDLKYIQKMIKYCQRKSVKLLVVTHHCPSYSVITGRKPKDKFISLYATALDHLLNSNSVHTWVAGHIHQNFDKITEGGTRLVSNQLGKPRDQVSTFVKDFVIEV